MIVDTRLLYVRIAACKAVQAFVECKGQRVSEIERAFETPYSSDRFVDLTAKA